MAKLLFVITTLFIFLAAGSSVLAAQNIVGPSLSLPSGTNPTLLGEVITELIPWLFSLAGITALIFLMVGGFRYLSSQGDQKATAQARQTITFAILGLVVVFISYWVVEILQTILGITIISHNLVQPTYAVVDIGNSLLLKGGGGKNINQTFGDLGKLVSVIIPAAITVAGLGFIAYLLLGAFKFVTSGGDQKAIDGAKHTITSALIGLLIVFASYWIIEILQTVTGIPILP